MRKYFGVVELFSCFAEAFVCTFLTSSTDRMLRMHSLASEEGVVGSEIYLREIGGVLKSFTVHGWGGAEKFF